jgi:hypothetical protein
MANFNLQIAPSATSKIFASGCIYHSGFRLRATRVVGVTGVEPVTLRLSSACSNQLSYTPPASPGGLRRGRPAFRERVLAPWRWLPSRSPGGAKAGGAEETRTPDL